MMPSLLAARNTSLSDWVTCSPHSNSEACRHVDIRCQKQTLCCHDILAPWRRRSAFSSSFLSWSWRTCEKFLISKEEKKHETWSSRHLTSMWFHDVPWRPHLQHIVTDDSSHNTEKCPRTQYCEENPNLSQSTNPWAPCASCVDLVKSLSSWPASKKGKLEKEDQPLPSTDLRHCDLRLKSAKIWMTSCQQEPFPYPIAQAALSFFAFKILKAPLASACPSLERRSLFQITGYKKTAILCFRSLLFGIANSVGTCATVRARTKSVWISLIKSTTKQTSTEEISIPPRPEMLP